MFERESACFCARGRLCVLSRGGGGPLAGEADRRRRMAAAARSHIGCDAVVPRIVPARARGRSQAALPAVRDPETGVEPCCSSPSGHGGTVTVACHAGPVSDLPAEARAASGMLRVRHRRRRPAVAGLVSAADCRPVGPQPGPGSDW